MKKTLEKIVAIILLVSFCMPVSLVAQVIEEAFFPGFDFNGSNVKTSLSDLTNDNINNDIWGEDENGEKKLITAKLLGRDDPYVIVGHSQGGLRALAAATMLKERSKNEPAAATAYENLKAVITVSGANKGFKGIENGFGNLRAKVYSDAGTLVNGVVATIAAFPTLSSIGLAVGSLFFSDEISGGIDSVMKLIGPAAQNYILPVLKNKNSSYDDLPELHDMMPRSKFISDNISFSEPHQYKKQAGTKTVWEWRSKKVWFARVYYLVRVQKPVYSYFTAYEDIPKFDLPVGYIVGTNHNTLDMAGDKKATVLTGLDHARKTFTAAEHMHYVKCGLLVGLLTGSVRHSQYARNAKNWVVNYQDHIHDILGSSEGDGFLAKESQYYPKTFTNPITEQTKVVKQNLLVNNKLGYIAMPEETHKSIEPTSNENVQGVITLLTSLIK